MSARLPRCEDEDDALKLAREIVSTLSKQDAGAKSTEEELRWIGRCAQAILNFTKRKKQNETGR